MLLPSHDVSSRRRQNMQTLLKLIHDHRRVTRKTLEQHLGSSSSSVAKYVQELRSMGFVREAGSGVVERGRSPVLLELSPDAGVSVAVVITRAGIKGALVNFSGEIVERCNFEFGDAPDRDLILATMYECIDCLRSRNNRQQRILGTGIAVAGFLDPDRGISHELLFARRWDSVPLKSLVEERYGTNAFLLNTANASALAEKYYGLGVGADNIVVVILDEGVGMGIIADGELYTGGNRYAGEFGHTRLAGNTAQCYCGHVGCLETVASKEYVLAKCGEALSRNVKSLILRYCNDDPGTMTIEHVIRAASEGDRLARNVFNEVGRTVGGKLADAVNVLDPELVILRGTTVDGNEALYRAIEREVLDSALLPAGKVLGVRFSDERTDSRFLGVHTHILNTYLSDANLVPLS